MKIVLFLLVLLIAAVAAVGRTFVIFSTWVDDQPLNATALNHFLYASANGYEFRHFHYNISEFHDKYGYMPSAWLTVFAAKQLSNEYPEDTFFVKMDIDCLFAQIDIKLDQFIDIMDNHSFYISEIENATRFTQSHMWIMRNTQFGRQLLDEWIEYSGIGQCWDLAMEQGAMHLAMGYFSWLYQKTVRNVTNYNCHTHCYHKNTRSAYRHHHCVLNWYAENGFRSGVSIHPEIYIVPFSATAVSPRDGFTFLLDKTAVYLPGAKPFTVHPCKKLPTLHPNQVMAVIPKC